MAEPILLFKPIFEEVAEEVTSQILEVPENETIDILLNSPGGSVSDGWVIIAAMNQHKAEKNITVMGDASSMAFFMLLFADNVTAHDTSNFLIHRAASFWEEIMTDEELEQVENRNKIILKKLSARIDEEKFITVTGKTFKDIFSMEGRLNVNLTAQQAKNIGLVHKIIKLDVKKRAEIESRYFGEIAALATNTNTNNSNTNNNNMGLFSKDPVLLGAIGDNQFVYSKLEVNAKIKATGEGEKEPLTGTFEAKDKKVTVVADVITAIEDIDTKQEQINALSSKIIALTALIEETVKKPIETEKVVDNSQEQITALTEKVTALTETLAKAKLSVSNPDLPKGEFAGNDTIEEPLTTRERIQAIQEKKHEDKRKKREE